MPLAALTFVSKRLQAPAAALLCLMTGQLLVAILHPDDAGRTASATPQAVTRVRQALAPMTPTISRTGR